MTRRSPNSGEIIGGTRGDARAQITALLGPTNTGKTHFAMERMLGYRSGMFGFPLRLLARENYDKAVAIKGERLVALITGEEKIVPPGARYFLCTVEAMPVDREVEFLAVDEVQLAADAERGHIFTDRLLYARGRMETVFIGADTVQSVLRRLVPKVEIVSRPRFSRLTYAGPKKLTRLPARSAVVGFSVTDVYALAEAVRRRRGGTAVVLGALSPRTRNAQVDMYQAGEVDYLVATDAIGMGLNMNVRHVAFSRLSKFDGRVTRPLSMAEIGQIAGRAGRHTKDGTFGTTAGQKPLEPEFVEAVESHSFEPVRAVYWRNPDLDFRDPQSLLASLAARPLLPHLQPARAADDFVALAALARDPAVDRAVTGEADVRLLWEVCQIPDFRKVTSDAHARLLLRIFTDLTGRGKLSPEWVARQVDHIDRADGDIGTLMGRIADIRTWTYIAHHSSWLDDPAHWQGRTRQIEDRLSDVLHDRLTERFVDRRTATLVKGLREKSDLIGAVRSDGEVLVEGVPVGRLAGIRFTPADNAGGEDGRAIRNAASRALRGALADRIRHLEQDDDGSLALGDQAQITWRGAPVARLVRGRHVLSPEVEVLAGDTLEPALRERAAARVTAWLDRHIARRFGDLRPDSAPEVRAPVRGILFQLGEGLGTVPRRQVAPQIGALEKRDRRALAERGVRLGRLSVHVPALTRPGALRLRALLWAASTGTPPADLPFDAMGGAPDWLDPLDRRWRELLEACGYVWCRGGHVRADRLEALGDMAFRLARQGDFAPTPRLRAVLGVDDARLRKAMAQLGFRWVEDGTGGAFRRSRKSRNAKGSAGRTGKPGARSSAGDKDSPFAALRNLKTR